MMKKKSKIVKLSVLSLAGLLILFFVLFGIYSISFAGKVYLNQFAGGTNYAGKSKDSVKQALSVKTKAYLDHEIKLTYQVDAQTSKDYAIKPADLALQFDTDNSTDKIWSYGRSDKIFISFWQQLSSIFTTHNQSLAYSINQESLDKKVQEIATQVDQPEKDYYLYYKDGKFMLSTDRKEGKRIDQELIKSQIKSQIEELKTGDIAFAAKDYKPQIDQNNANKRLAEANDILKAGELVLTFDSQQFKIDLDTIGGLIKSKSNGNDMEIVTDDDRLNIFVDNLAQNINVDPQNAKLTISGGKAVVFATARLGQTLDKVQTKVDIQNSLFARIPDKSVKADPAKIALKVETKKPEITDDTISNLGINELVGTGTTDFKTSPSNRVHNIQIGSSAINGTLLKPGDEFSTLKQLGKIDASAGYLPELVIKNNQTVPDYGGGLCQVSTTLFRAAMNAGLKITERYNHSYRVSYYEPPVGMDATIFDPSPDFKFVNNYDHYLLVQSHIDGTKITFEIYGTKDGRVATVSNPSVYDYVSPPPSETTETDTLPAGQRQQIQKAHQGASASFNYHVEKNGQVLQDKTFVSKYVALPEKWLVGKGTEPVPAQNPPASAPESSAPAAEPSPSQATPAP